MRVIASAPAFGERIAGSSGTGWAVAYGDWVTCWDGVDPANELRLAEPALELRYDGGQLLAAPSRPGTELPLLSAALAPWHAVAATWDGDRLLVAEAPGRGQHDQRVRLVDGRTRAPGPVLWADSKWKRVETVATGPGRLAAAALEVRVWDARTLAEVLVVPERGKQVRRVLLTSDAVIAGYSDGQVVVHDLAEWRAHADEACALALHPDGDWLATAGWDRRVALWTLSGELLAEASALAEIADIAFLGRDRLLALHKLPATGVTVLALA